MGVIYFVRHGTYENPKGVNPFRLPGFPLAEEGVKQIKKDGEYFQNKKIAAIYTSPILRTKQSAEILSRFLGLKPEINELLIEIRSPYQGYKKEYIHNKVGNIYSDNLHKKKGGETIDEIQYRMEVFVQKVLKSHPGKELIVVSHGDPIMFYLMKQVGIKVFGTQKRWDKYAYIPTGGVLKAKFSSDKLHSLEQINY